MFDYLICSLLRQPFLQDPLFGFLKVPGLFLKIPEIIEKPHSR